MKKTILIINLTMIVLLLGCIDYSNYKEVKIPDENLGTLKIPHDWELKLVDGWIHIINTETEELIGVQYYKGDYYIKEQVIHDERHYNAYFDEYESIGWKYNSGNSNGSQFGIRHFKSNEIINEYRFISFDGITDRKDDIEIIILSNDINDNTLSNIAKSYKR